LNIGTPTTRKLTAARRRAIIQATIGPLRPFRRGYARVRTGPYFDLRTIDILISTGALRPVDKFNPLRLLTALES
jgi:hypothetical protein